MCVILGLKAESQDKRDKIPTQSGIETSRNSIFRYWNFYHSKAPERFDSQLHQSLGVDKSDRNWEKTAIFGLIEMAERIAESRGIGRWSLS